MWESRSDGEDERRGNKGNAKDTLDWKLIREKIDVKDRQETEEMYALNMLGKQCKHRYNITRSAQSTGKGVLNWIIRSRPITKPCQAF